MFGWPKVDAPPAGCKCPSGLSSGRMHPSRVAVADDSYRPAPQPGSRRSIRSVWLALGGIVVQSWSAVRAPGLACFMRWGFVTMVAILLAGCGMSSPHASRSPQPTVTARSSTPRPLVPPKGRCSGPDTLARTIWLHTGDRVDIDAVEFGSGGVGAVFLHESPSDLCDWWGFAKALADAGVHGMLIDLRCNGMSSCPSVTAAETRPDQDVRAAVQELRRRGARRVTVVGASYGGACALVAASQLGGEVDAVASLSGEPNLQPELDVTKVIGRLQVPLLLAVAPGDPYVTVAQTRAMLQRAGSPHKQLIIQPEGAGHGVALLVQPDQSGLAPLFKALTAFIHRST